MSEESGLWSLRLGDFGLAVQLQPGEELRGIEAGRMAMEDLKRLIESGGTTTSKRSVQTINVIMLLVSLAFQGGKANLCHADWGLHIAQSPGKRRPAIA